MGPKRTFIHLTLGAKTLKTIETLALNCLVGTIIEVPLLLSSPNPENQVLILRLPQSTEIHVQFLDEEHSRDLTIWASDLALLGLSERHKQNVGLSPQPSEEVEVAKIELRGGDFNLVSAFWAHPETQSAAELDWRELAELIGLGITSQITAGVAHEAADVPDSPSEITPSA